jgi:hypothetical protein
MKRSDFLKEMGASLFQTVKYAYEPFVRDDLQKVEDVADRALGIKWMPLMKEEETEPMLEMKFLEGNPVIISRHDTNMQVMDGVCPVCSNIIVVTALYSTGKCLNCEKEFNFKTKQGELQLESFPIKVKDKTIFIGFQKHKKLGGIRA